MRIAIVSDWFAPRRGGVETQLLQLAEHLGRAGHSVDVLTTTPAAAQGKAFRARVIDVPRLPSLDVALSPQVLSALRRELEGQYDVVHSHVSVVSPAGYAGAYLGSTMGVPTVVTFHSVLRYKRWLLRIASALGGWDRAQIVWSAVSAKVAAQARQALGGVSEIQVLPNGIDLAYWRGTDDTERPGGDVGHRLAPAAQNGSREVVLVSALRLHRKKRPHQLVNAFFAAAVQAGVPARLQIAGEGPERRHLERVISEHGFSNGARVELLGWMEPSLLRPLYKRAHAFALASTREAFGIAALEARAAGLPVIAMKAAGCAEFLADGGDAMLCENDAQLVAALRRFIASQSAGRPILQAPPASGDDRLGGYDWREVVRRHEAAYALASSRSNAAAGAAAR